MRTEPVTPAVAAAGAQSQRFAGEVERSPEARDPAVEARPLLDEIRGASRKPAPEQRPAVVNRSHPTAVSPAAMALPRV